MGCVEGKLKSVDDPPSWSSGSAKVYVDPTIRPVCVLRMPIEDDSKTHKRTSSKNTGQINASYQSTGSPHEPNDNNSDINQPPNTKCMSNLNKFDCLVTDKYRFLRLMGGGRFSNVWLVENRLTKIPCALKMTSGVEGREIFNSELEILSRVRHPNVIQLIETFEKENRFYMVTELATGGDLFDRTQSQPGGFFAESDAASIIYMISKGLRFLHQLGVTHRDLKLDNILFYHPGPDSRVLITDFAVANLRKSDNRKFMTTACGTPEYIAPEILLQQPYTSSVDLWSLGVIVFSILSGSFPFANEENNLENNNQLYMRIVKGDYSFRDKVWNDVSQLGMNFIKNLLQCDPEKRLSAAEVSCHSWVKTYAASVHSSLSSSDEAFDHGSSTHSGINRRQSRPYLDRDPELTKLKQRILQHRNLRF